MVLLFIKTAGLDIRARIYTQNLFELYKVVMRHERKFSTLSIHDGGPLPTP
jgi:hypothetical protein